MKPFAVFRSGLLLTILWAVLGTSLQAAGGFSSTLSSDERTAAGLANLTAPELSALDQLIAADLAFARSADTTISNGDFTSRHNATEHQNAGLDRLSAEQLAKLDELIDTPSATKPQPKERPRLTHRDLLGRDSRLEVHGGVSLTLGGASGGGSFREASGWVSFFDPVTGISLGVGYSDFSGDGIVVRYPGDYYYDDFGYGYFPSQRILPQDYYGTGRRYRGNYFRGNGQSTEVELRVPLIKGSNALTFQFNAESTRLGN